MPVNRRRTTSSRAGITSPWLLALFGALGGLLACYLILDLVRSPFRYSPLVDGWLVDGFEVAAGLICVARALVRQRGRAVALVLGLGVVSWGLGDTVWTALTAGGHTPEGSPLADALWLAFYPLAYVAVVLLIKREVRALDSLRWLDGIVAAGGAASVCAAFTFHGPLQYMGDGLIADASRFAFPIGDLVLFAIVVAGVALLSRRATSVWVLLAAAMVLNAVGDTFNLFQPPIGSPRVDAFFRVLAWPAASLLMALAVWQRTRPPNILAPRKPGRLLLPGLAATASVVILAVGSLYRVSPVALGIAMGTLVAVGIRVVLTLRGLNAITRERLEQSLTDELTGLGNRRYLFEVLDEFFADQTDGTAPERNLSFLFVDLKRFKEVNDAFGHVVGDELLKQIGPRLRASLRHSEVLVRIGGDEFGIVLLDADADGATSVARRMTFCLEEPFLLNGVSVPISANIGIATAPADATDCAGLLRCADAAMYRAKMSNCPWAGYDEDLDDGGNLWGFVEELRSAVENRELVLHYQPQLDLRDGTVSAVEALVRWPHPRLGMVPPNKFIPLAEQAGLMSALTRSVLDQALSQCATWRQTGDDVSVSVNVSPTNLLEPGFSDLVRGMLDLYRLEPSALVLEITETSLIANLETVKRVVNEMKQLGVVVSIDDFGAGFTSLAYLSGLAVGELKLDGEFIRRLDGEDAERDLELVGSMIELGHAVGLTVVAECIETKETLDLLLELGCDRGQGYFIGRPVPAGSLELAAPSSELELVTTASASGARG